LHVLCRLDFNLLIGERAIYGFHPRRKGGLNRVAKR
jgi:hypothetical protein